MVRPDPNDYDLYCNCRRKSSGNMILCDNINCRVGWFHYKCVKLIIPPKYDWFCPNCKILGFKSKRGRPRVNVNVIEDLDINGTVDKICFCNTWYNEETIRCNNECCNIQWFHLNCVRYKPVKNQIWYCTRCSRLAKNYFGRK